MAWPRRPAFGSTAGRQRMVVDATVLKAESRTTRPPPVTRSAGAKIEKIQTLVIVCTLVRAWMDRSKEAT